MEKEMEPQSLNKAGNWQELEENLFMQTIKRQPITLVRGLGARVWDDKDREYLDFMGGWAVNSLGHCHPTTVEAIKQQAQTLIHTSNQFYTIPQIQLAQALVEHSCLDRIFFCNSGAEANEGAIKLARRYGKLYLDGAYEIVTTHNSFHGRTLAMVAATGQHKFQEPYIPLPNGFINVDYNDVEAIKAVIGPKTCAVMLEPVQGEGGVNVPSKDYLKEIRALCDKKGVLLILDEIQTGVGRMGSLFAYEQYGIEPDIMTLAKGLGSGVPIGAFLAKDQFSVFAPGDHGNTFGGSPLMCSVSLAALKFIIQNNIPDQVKRVGKYFMSQLEKFKGQFNFISEVRGGGLLLALGFTSDISQEILQACLHEGLLINSVKPDAIRFTPPLIIDENDVDEALRILELVFNRR